MPRPAPRSLPSLLLCCALPAACSYGAELDLQIGEPPGFELIAASPTPGTTGVPRATAVELTFSAAPDAETVADVDVRVFSGLIEAAGTVRVDLLERKLRMRPFRTLRPTLRYQVYLAGEIRGLNGAKLPKTVVFDFTTGESEGSPPPAPSPPPGASALQPLFAQRCASCHAGPEGPMAVDLSSAGAALRTLRGIPGSTGLLRVVPGDHGRSYLVRKLLGEGGHLGAPMPPDEPRLPAADLRRVADWIDGGATP